MKTGARGTTVEAGIQERRLKKSAAYLIYIRLKLGKKRLAAAEESSRAGGVLGQKNGKKGGGDCLERITQRTSKP